MAREYKLKLKATPDAIRDAKAAEHHRASQPVAPEDFIDLHHKLGDEFEFEYDGATVLGTVQRSLGPFNLIIASDGEAYREDTRKQTYTLLTDANRCNHCGGFFCSRECPNHNAKNISQMKEEKLIPLSEVLAIAPGDNGNASWVNARWQAVISNIKEPKGNGPWGATASQASNPNIKLHVNFWKVNPSRLDGKLVEFSGQAMRRTEYKNKFGKTTQQVDVGEKTTIDVIGESAHSGGGSGGQATPSRQDRSDASYRPETANTGDLTDVSRRAACYFGVLRAVEKEYVTAQAKGLGVNLNEADLKDIATHLSMTYRGQYGSYMEPVFSSGGAPAAKPAPKVETMAEMEEKDDIPFDDPPPARQVEEKPKQSWKSFMHPKRKIPLGDMEDADLLKLARWARGQDGDVADAVKPFHDVVMLMASDKRWGTAQALFTNSLVNNPRYEDDEGFNDTDVEEYLEAELGHGLAQLTEEEASNLVGDFDGVVDGIVDFAEQKRKEASKKPKKKQAEMPD